MKPATQTFTEALKLRAEETLQVRPESGQKLFGDLNPDDLAPIQNAQDYGKNGGIA